MIHSQIGQKQHHTPVEAHHSCTWKDSIISTTTRKERKRKPTILPLFHKGQSSQPCQVHWDINFSDLFLHRVSFPFFSSLALGCFSVPTERRQALSQLGTDGEITARESRVRGACVKRWGTHTPDRRNSTAGTIQHERERDREREKKKKRGRRMGSQRLCEKKKEKERSASLNIEKGCYSLLSGGMALLYCYRCRSTKWIVVW